ncbi:MAG: DUF6273 domain-containing protein [Syntrophomonas sp.]
MRYKNFKFFIMMMIAIALLFGNWEVTHLRDAYAASTSDIETGQYIQFGSYYNEPILWRVINKNDDGSLMLLSEKILCLKPFDANGDPPEGEGDADRRYNGSNNWENSNIRDWLNSSGQTVTYTAQPPDDSHVDNGWNNYESEPGFLYNFTQLEQDAIEPHTYKSILASVDSSAAEGGTALYTFNSDIEQVVQNFDNAYYKNVTDRVFLLDVKELHDYVFGRGYEHKRRPTAAAAAHSEYTIDSAEYWYYWLRTPETASSSNSIFICYLGLVNYDSACNGDHGVLPALNLKAGISTVGGDGTESNPYIIIGDGSDVPQPPAAGGVQITGDARIGNVLTGNYRYSDENGDAESGSVYRWLRADSIEGEYLPIADENSISYTVKDEDIDKYLKFEVVPITAVEPMQGGAMQSPAVKVYKSSNANLGYIRYNGVSITGFNNNQTDYAVELPPGTVQIPAVSAEPADDRAQTEINNTTVLPGNTVIKVIAEDGTAKTYTVSFTVAPSILESEHPYANNLDFTWTYALDVQCSTVLVTFSQSTEVEENCDYIYVMDENGITIPGGRFTGQDLKGKTVKVPGNTVKIRLTSDSDQNLYGFTVTDIRPEPSLTGIKVNGVDIGEFEPSQLYYRYILSSDSLEVPLVTAEAPTDTAYKIVPASSIPGDTKIEVQDSMNNLVKTYVIEFRYLGDVGVGDYIRFGSYLNEPILWRVIKMNDDGSVMLLSDKILCLKPFDANGDLTDGRGDSERISYGSNNWEKSNLREWLNSESETVTYNCQAPDGSHVINGNEYYDEPGFLYNFTPSERNMIQAVTHRNILSEVDSSVSDGGTELHVWDSSLSDIVQNFDNAYYKNTLDRVFLLDIKELHDYVYNCGFELKRNLTEAASADSVYKPNNSEYWYYWLRTPCADNSYLERFVFGEDGEGYDFLYAYDGRIGVLPALNIKSEFSTSEGNGSQTSPYKVNEGANPVAVSKTPEDKAGDVGVKQEITVVFDIEVVLEDLINLKITDADNNLVKNVSAVLKSDNKTLSILHDDFANNTTYTVYFPEGAVKSVAHGIINNGMSWSFTTTEASTPEGCFIATAAFGSYLDPHVWVLRKFRDNVLLQTDWGRWFVEQYYKYSPPLAAIIAQHESLRTITRWVLTPVVYGVEYPRASGELLLGAIIVIVCVRRYRLQH